MRSYISDFGRGNSLWQAAGTGIASIHFAAANGFPAASYRYFLELLSDSFGIQALENRGMWPGQAPPGEAADWQDHSDDLIAFLDAQMAAGQLVAPVTGVGHSIGATVTLLAATRRPELFSRLVLIDPASLPPLGREGVTGAADRKLTLVDKTRNRRRRWSSREEFLAYLPTRGVYQNFCPQALRDYADAGLVASDDGDFELAYAPAWEAQNFVATPMIWSALETIQIPTLLLHGESSEMFAAVGMEQLAAGFSPAVATVLVKGCGHLIPQEAPEPLAQLILQWLAAPVDGQ